MTAVTMQILILFSFHIYYLRSKRYLTNGFKLKTMVVHNVKGAKKFLQYLKQHCKKAK